MLARNNQSNKYLKFYWYLKLLIKLYLNLKNLYLLQIKIQLKSSNVARPKTLCFFIFLSTINRDYGKYRCIMKYFNLFEWSSFLLIIIFFLKIIFYLIFYPSHNSINFFNYYIVFWFFYLKIINYFY